MSSIARWSYVEGPATVWPYTIDQFSQPSYGTPYLIPAIDYESTNQVQMDEQGNEFVARMIYYFEDDGTLAPKRGWFIKVGSHTNLSAPPTDAHKVQKVTHWPMEKFGAGETPDYAVYT